VQNVHLKKLFRLNDAFDALVCLPAWHLTALSAQIGNIMPQ